jgi:hypothetical protein
LDEFKSAGIRVINKRIAEIKISKKLNSKVELQLQSVVQSFIMFGIKNIII